MSTDSFFLTGEDVSAKPYLYRACGLDGIYLMNGYTVETHDGEEHVAVSDIDGLHKAIGRHLVTFRKALSPKEIRFLRNTLDLTQAELAQRLGNTTNPLRVGKRVSAKCRERPRNFFGPISSSAS